MELLRIGARGDAVLDVQTRLSSLGYDVADDRGVFGEATRTAVRAFQDDRGLIGDGIVGSDTWRQLVEASWRLGDRVLYLRAPNLRGDDVRELQDRLSTFGFAPGRTDGIFGGETERAVREFQHNYGLPADGIVAEQTVRALAGLPRMAGDTTITSVREREAMRLRGGGMAAMRIVLDPGHGGDDPGIESSGGATEAEVCMVIARAAAGALTAAGAQVYLSRSDADGPEDDARVALANALEADVFVSIHVCDDAEGRGVRTYFFGHQRYRSEQGAELADLLVQEARAAGLATRGSEPKTVTVLRETKMPAVFVEVGSLANEADARALADPSEQGRVATALVAAIRRYAREPASV